MSATAFICSANGSAGSSRFCFRRHLPPSPSRRRKKASTRFDGSQFGQGGLEIALATAAAIFGASLARRQRGLFFVLLQQAFIDFAQLGIGFSSRFCTRLLAQPMRRLRSCLNAAAACSLAVKSSNGAAVCKVRRQRCLADNRLQQHSKTRLHKVNGFRRRFR